MQEMATENTSVPASPAGGAGVVGGGPSINDPTDYEPYEHRQVNKPTNNFESFIHILKCSLGTGMLAMPQAFSKAGIIIGPVFLGIIGFIVTYCIQLLVQSQYKLCKLHRVPIMTYPEALRAALEIGPPCLRRCKRCIALSSDVFLIVYQLGICCVYIVFMASSIKQLVDPYYEMSIQLHTVCLLGPLIALNLIRSLKALAPLSTLANVMILVGLTIIVYYVFTLPRTNAPLDYWGSVLQFPLFFGTALFALTSVGVVLAVENNMKTPRSFRRLLGPFNLAMLVVVASYIFLGVVGYLFCVSECKDSITHNIPDNEPLAISLAVLYIVAMFISYALHCYVPVEILWKTYFNPCLRRRGMRRELMYEYIFRAGICIFTFLLAVSLPHLGLFISLFGALCLSALGMIFPALMEICIQHASRNYGLLNLNLVKDIIIIILGLVGLVVGTYTAVSGMVETFISK